MLSRLLKLTAVMAFTLVDTSMAVYHKHVQTAPNTTGYTAHVAGSLAGLVVGFFALENRSETDIRIILESLSHPALRCFTGMHFLGEKVGPH